MAWTGLAGVRIERLRGLLPALLVLACVASQARAATPYDTLLAKLQPQAAPGLSDFAGAISQSDRQALDERARALQQKTGDQLAIVVLDSLEGGEVDDFTNKLFKRWGVGEKGKDNGVMLLVALKDHKARVEVGYGLEQYLPDALAGRILDEDLFPAFKRGQYGPGLRAAVDRMASRLESRQPASAAERAGRRRGNAPPDACVTPFLSIFVAVGFLMAGLGIGARVVFLIIWGLCFGGIPLFMAAVISRTALWILLGVAFVFFVMGLRGGRRNPRALRSGGRTARKWAQDPNVWMWGATNTGGSSGWGSSGGGFGGGGFSGGGFGGGSSGGGGASGSW